MGDEKRRGVTNETISGASPDLPAEHPDREKQRIELYNLELLADGNILPNGMMSRTGWTARKLEKLSKARRDKDFQRFLFRLVVQDLLDRIEALIEYHKVEMQRLLLEIEQKQEALDQLEEEHLALQGVIEGFGKNGQLLINNSAQQAIDAYELRSGEQVVSPDYQAILKIDAETSKLASKIRMSLLNKQAQYDHHSVELSSLQEMKERLGEVDNTNDLEGFFNKLEQHESDKKPNQEEIDEQLASLFQLSEVDDTELEQSTGNVSRDSYQSTKSTSDSMTLGRADENKNIPKASKPLLPANAPFKPGS